MIPAAAVAEELGAKSAMLIARHGVVGVAPRPREALVLRWRAPGNHCRLATVAKSGGGPGSRRRGPFDAASTNAAGQP